jgi:hypothetical protein
MYCAETRELKIEIKGGFIGGFEYYRIAHEVTLKYEIDKGT